MKDLNRSKKSLHTARAMRRSLPENFCTAPFTQMFVYPTGDVHVCCEGIGKLGNIKERSLEEIWNGPEARRLRREFIEGKPIQCDRNIKCKGCHKNYDDQLLHTQLTEIQEEPPKALDLILNGKCNIDCIMCEVKNQVQSIPADKNFQTEIAGKVYPRVKKISLKSGEPLVQKETFDIIKTVSEINPDCVWQITTNGQYKFNSVLQELLNKIRIERINFSVDAIDSDLFAIIRKDGSLEKCLQAIHDIQLWAQTKDQPFPVDFFVNITLQKLNWRNVPDTMLYFSERNMTCSLLFVDEPFEFSLLGLPEEKICEILLYYINLPQKYDPYLRRIVDCLSPVIRKYSDGKVKKLAVMLESKIAEYAKRRKDLCPLLFSQIAQFPDGTVKPCCWLGDYDFGKKSSNTYMDVWNGIQVKDLRERNLKGETSACTPKMKSIGCHKTHEYLRPLLDFKREQDGPPVRLDWFFNGKCNLQCKSCHNWHYDEEFTGSDAAWESLKKEILPHICEIDLKGGEPFYQKRTYQLIKTMKEINPTCVWDITTNGQIALNAELKSYLDGLIVGTFAVSIDSLDERNFSTIRKGGELKKALAFLDELIRYNSDRKSGQKFRICVNFVIQKENWNEVEEMIQFCQKKSVDLYIIPMVDPSDYSIYSLPRAELNEVHNHAKTLAAKYPAYTSVTDLTMAIAKETGG